MYLNDLSKPFKFMCIDSFEDMTEEDTVYIKGYEQYIRFGGIIESLSEISSLSKSDDSLNLQGNVTEITCKHCGQHKIKPTSLSNVFECEYCGSQYFIT